MATLHHETPSVATSTARHETYRGQETKPSFKTTEMIVLVAAVVGVLAASTMDDSLNTLWAWILISALSTGYMLSRGLAKSGSRHVDSN